MGWGEAPSCACGEVIFLLGKEFPVWPFGGSTYTPVTSLCPCRAMKPLEVSSGAFTLGELGTLYLPWEEILVPVIGRLGTMAPGLLGATEGNVYRQQCASGVRFVFLALY